MGEEPLLEELGDRLWELSSAALLGGGEGGHHVCWALTRLRTPMLRAPMLRPPHGTGRRGRLLGRRNGGWTNCDGGREVVGGHITGGEHELLVGIVWAMGDTRIVVSGDALLGGEWVPIARGRGGRRWGSKGSPRGRWPGSGGRRRIGAVVVMIERRELGTSTRRLGRIDGGGELVGVEVLMGWVPSGRCRGRGTFWERACGGQGAERGGRGGWLRVGKGMDWGKEDALVKGDGRLLVERGRIGRGLGVGTHPAEVVGVGWVHGRRGRKVVAGGGSGAVAAFAAAAMAAATAASGAVVVVVVVVVGDVERDIHERQRRQRTDGRQRRWRRRRGGQRRPWISQSTVKGDGASERQSDRTTESQQNKMVIHSIKISVNKLRQHSPKWDVERRRQW